MPLQDENKFPSPLAGEPKTQLPTASVLRKVMPMARGLLDYFPAAAAYVSYVSWVGNEKHNKGEELYHSRGKSADHADCIVRHVAERGTLDEPEWSGGPRLRHTGKLAWRALALLQEELEEAEGLPLPRGARAK